MQGVCKNENEKKAYANPNSIWNYGTHDRLDQSKKAKNKCLEKLNPINYWIKKLKQSQTTSWFRDLKIYEPYLNCSMPQEIHHW